MSALPSIGEIDRGSQNVSSRVVASIHLAAVTIRCRTVGSRKRKTRVYIRREPVEVHYYPSTQYSFGRAPHRSTRVPARSERRAISQACVRF
jgi:hypothetical protein